MKKLSVLSLVILCLCVNGCYRNYTLAVEFGNSSSNGELVRNMKVVWNGYNLVEEVGFLSVCGSPSQVHYIKNLFGPVSVEWKNAKGQKLSKDFIFRKEDFPNYKKDGSYVILYFNQSDVEYYTTDTPNIRKIQKEKNGNWVLNYIEGKGQKCVNDPKERKRINELRKKYPNYSTITGKPIYDE